MVFVKQLSLASFHVKIPETQKLNFVLSESRKAQKLIKPPYISTSITYCIDLQKDMQLSPVVLVST